MAAIRLVLFPRSFPAFSSRLAGFCGKLCSPCSSKRCCSDSTVEDAREEREKRCVQYSEGTGNAVMNGNVLVKEDFVSKREEEELVKEVRSSFRRVKYEYDHWDGVRLNMYN